MLSIVGNMLNIEICIAVGLYLTMLMMLDHRGWVIRKEDFVRQPHRHSLSSLIARQRVQERMPRHLHYKTPIAPVVFDICSTFLHLVLFDNRMAFIHNY